MFKNSDSFGDADMKEQLKQMEVTIHELLVTDAELPDMDELSAQISELQLEHQKFTQEVLRVTPTISAEEARGILSTETRGGKSPCYTSAATILEKPVASHSRGGTFIRWTRL